MRKVPQELIDLHGFITIVPFSVPQNLYIGVSKKGRTYNKKYSITLLKFDEDFMNITYESHEISLKCLPDIRLVFEYFLKKF